MEKIVQQKKITAEQIQLVRVMSELENSISIVKEQINALTVRIELPAIIICKYKLQKHAPSLTRSLQVETLHLKYLNITKANRNPGSSQVNSVDVPDFSVKTNANSQALASFEVEEDSD